MKKSVFVESILLRITGGTLTNQAAIQRADIRAYLPAAVNYTMNAGYNIEIKQEGDRDFSSLFYGYFASQAVLVDSTRHNWKYFLMPKGGVALPKNQDIRSVEDNLGNKYIPLPDSAMATLNYYLEYMHPACFYRREGKKIYLFNAPEIIETINESQIVNCDDLADDDELPIPAGLEGLALQTCFEFLTGQRTTQADRNNDKRDIN